MNRETKSAAYLIGAGALVAGSVIAVAIGMASLAADRITVDHSSNGSGKDETTLVAPSAPILTELPPVEIAEPETFGEDSDTSPVTDQPGLITLEPCPTEDSDNCYWQAATMGNGVGVDFVTIDATTYYAER